MRLTLTFKLLFIVLFIFPTISLFSQLEILPSEIQFTTPMRIKHDGQFPSNLELENKSAAFYNYGGFSIAIYGGIVYNTNGTHIFQKEDETIMQIAHDMKGVEDANVIVDKDGILKRGRSTEKYYTVTGVDIASFNNPSFGTYSLPPIDVSGYGNTTFYLPVHIPDNALISSITFKYRDSVSENLRLGLYYVNNNAGGSETTIGVHTSAGSSTPFPNHSALVQLTPHTINNLERTYYIKVVPVSGTWPSSNNNLSFVSASIKYQ